MVRLRQPGLRPGHADADPSPGRSSDDRGPLQRCRSGDLGGRAGTAQVAGLCLVGPFLREGKPSPILRLAGRIVTGSPLLWTRFYYPSLYKAAKPADFGHYLRVMRSLLHEPGRMAALRGVATEQERCRARIPELRCPVWIVMGTKDPDFPDAVAEARQGEALIGESTEVSLELIDGAGHYPHAELPEVTASAILPFLADVVSG
jgi:pimeloyl-ACP methyl ester carboxylesterase